MNESLEDWENSQQQPYYKMDALHLVLAMGLFFVGLLISGFLRMGLYYVVSDENYEKYLSPFIFILPFVFCIGTYYLLFLKNKNLRYNFGFSLVNWYLYPIMFALFLGAIFINEPIVNAIPKSGLGGLLDETYKLLEEMEKLILKYPITNALTIAVLAPIFEELIFRGLILKGLLNNKVKPVYAILISAFIFALVHLNIWQFVGAFLLGSIMGFIYYKTQSLLNCILLHAFNNGLGLAVFFMTDQLNISEAAETSDLLAIVTGVALLAFFGGLFVKLTKNNVWKFY